MVIITIVLLYMLFVPRARFTKNEKPRRAPRAEKDPKDLEVWYSGYLCIKTNVFIRINNSTQGHSILSSCRLLCLWQIHRISQSSASFSHFELCQPLPLLFSQPFKTPQFWKFKPFIAFAGQIWSTDHSLFSSSDTEDSEYWGSMWIDQIYLPDSIHILQGPWR